MADLPGTWREPNRDAQIPRNEAMQAWSNEAVQVLEDVARHYGAYVTYKEFSVRLFAATGIHTRQQLNYWIGDVLANVISRCSERQLPELSSLVVRAGDGIVGSGFNTVLRRQGREAIEDPYQLELAAAKERLNCYRVYCPNIPSDAAPQLTREYSARVARKDTVAPRARPVCPSCGLQLPATGICDDCA